MSWQPPPSFAPSTPSNQPEQSSSIEPDNANLATPQRDPVKSSLTKSQKKAAWAPAFVVDETGTGEVTSPEPPETPVAEKVEETPPTSAEETPTADAEGEGGGEGDAESREASLHSSLTKAHVEGLRSRPSHQSPSSGGRSSTRPSLSRSAALISPSRTVSENNTIPQQETPTLPPQRKLSTDSPQVATVPTPVPPSPAAGLVPPKRRSVPIGPSTPHSAMKLTHGESDSALRPPPVAQHKGKGHPKSALRGKGISSPAGKADRGGVNWNQTLFVVDQTQAKDAGRTVKKSDREINISRVESKRLSRSVSRREHIIVDQTLLKTRLEWNQLLVSKAFKPYRLMMCEIDDDLPDAEDLEAMEDDDYIEDEEMLDRIRADMLDDPEISEREIAAFFEGFKLFQIKINSLRAQLEGMKAMQRLNVRDAVVMSTRSLQHHLGFSSDREVGRERPVQAHLPRSSLPADRTTMMRMAKTSKSNPPTPKTRRGTQTLLGHISETPKEKEPRETPGSEEVVPKPATEEPETEEAAGSQTTEATEAPEPEPEPAKEEPAAEPTKAKKEESKEKEKSPVPKRELSKDGPVQMISRSRRLLSIKRIKESSNFEDTSDVGKLLAELEEAEKRQKKLEKQLAQAGVVIAEDIPYDVAKQKIASIAKRMGEIGSSDVADPKLREEYFKLEQGMEKYTAALMLTDEYAEEQEELERQWIEQVTPRNEEAIKKVRRHMPVHIRNMSESALCTQASPNGKYLPKKMVKKFKRTNVLQLLRMDPEDIVPMHPASLENYRVTGLTLTERRALYQHLKDVGPRWKAMQSDKMTERKWTWFNMMKSNFKENVDSWQRHIDQYGPPENHDCPLIGNQCPVKGDKVIDYDGDYGFPEGPEYFKSEVKKSDVDNADKAKQEALEALREKKSLERSEKLKKHYRNKILQVSLANGSCEAMDEAMDNMETTQEKYIKAKLTTKGEMEDGAKKNQVVFFNESLKELKLSMLQFAEKSGMQLTGKRDANADQPDTRSMIELALSEEVIETANDFFEGIEERMDEMQMKDGRMNSTISQLKTLLDELHERNVASIEALGGERPERSRKLKSRKDMADALKKEIEKEEKAKQSEEAAAAGPPAGGMPGRGGRGGGRGDLLAALGRGKGRGRGRGGDDEEGGRGGLMAAIAGRGRGKGRGGRGGGRGDLMSAIAGRGRGGDGGRGGLMAAIAARGGGG